MSRNQQVVGYGSTDRTSPQVMCSENSGAVAGSLRGANHEDEALVEAWIRKAFSLFDQDGKGYVDSVDFADDIQHLFPNCKEEEVEELLEDTDPNGVGVVTFDNFCRAMSRRLKGKVPFEALQEGFKAFDRDGDGYIDAHDLTEHLSNFVRERDERENAKAEETSEPSRGRTSRESSFRREAKSSSHERSRNKSRESRRSASPDWSKYEHEAEELIAKRDLDHDGRINMQEFVDAASEEHDMEQDDEK
jgi:Ca2+-binding EF-hand superfamily protein